MPLLWQVDAIPYEGCWLSDLLDGIVRPGSGRRDEVNKGVR